MQGKKLFPLGQGHGENVLRQGLRKTSSVGSYRNMLGNPSKGNIICPGKEELHKCKSGERVYLGGGNLSGGKALAEKHRGLLQSLSPGISLKTRENGEISQRFEYFPGQAELFRGGIEGTEHMGLCHENHSFDGMVVTLL
jgi:hypothetical protein